MGRRTLVARRTRRYVGAPWAAAGSDFTTEKAIRHMVPAKYIAAVLIAACMIGPSHAATAEPATGAATAEHGRAYLFRGLIGLIDWGMDELAARITRNGVSA